MISYYSLLKIPFTANQADVEQAYKNFREELVSYGPGTELSDEEIKKQFPEISEAYTVLLDPVSRKQYDESLKEEPRFAGKTEPGADGDEETDEVPVPIRNRLGMIASYIGFGLLVLAVLYAFSQLFLL